MGLMLTLPRECNNLFCEFPNAYWAITELGYDTEACYFVLACYPSREHKLLNGSMLPQNALPIGGVASNMIQTELYKWKGTFPLSLIFKEGIPIDANVQKTEIYNFIKKYLKENKMGIQFEDVFEEWN